MHLLYHVLTASVILVAGTDGSTKSVDDQTEAAARPLSFAFLRVSETPSVVSSLSKQHHYGEIKTNDDQRQQSEERMLPVPTPPEALLADVDIIKNAVVKTEEVIKNLGKGMTTNKLVGENKIDQEEVVPVRYGGARNRRRNNAESSTAISQYDRYRESRHERLMALLTSKLIKNVQERMTTDKLIVERSIAKQKQFVELLRDEFSKNHRWNYGDVLSSLMRMERIGDEWLHRVNPEDLMIAFHELRSLDGMKDHADGMQEALAKSYPGFELEKELFALWLKSKVTPEEALKMWTTVAPVRSNHIHLISGAGQATYDRNVVPMAKYITDYRKMYGYSQEAAEELMQRYNQQGHELDFQLHTNFDKFPDRG